MLLLADENLPLATIEALRRAGHNVAWARTDAPGTGDAALLDLAEADGRVLLTLDKDFWQIAIQRRQPLERSGVILFRVHPAIPENVTPLEYVIGVVLAFDVRGLATVMGLDRSRSSYPTILIVIATSCVLFGVMGASGRSLCLVAAALAAHGVFDLVRHLFIPSPGQPDR